MATKTLFVFSVLLTWQCHVTAELPIERVRRSDDPSPLENVVTDLSQKVTQLTAQLQAQQTEISGLKNKLDTNLETRIATLESPVAFTVRSKQGDRTGLGSGQTIKFDHVLYNVGGGYSPATGLFTAPSPGTYAFFLQGMAHYSEQQSELQVYKGTTLLVNVFNCCAGDAANSGLATVHLNAGDEVHVQMARGSSFYGGVYTAFSGLKISPQ